MPILNETYYDTIKNKGSIDMTKTMHWYSPGNEKSAKNLHKTEISASVGGLKKKINSHMLKLMCPKISQYFIENPGVFIDNIAKS